MEIFRFRRPSLRAFFGINKGNLEFQWVGGDRNVEINFMTRVDDRTYSFQRKNKKGLIIKYIYHFYDRKNGVEITHYIEPSAGEITHTFRDKFYMVEPDSLPEDVRELFQ